MSEALEFCAAVMRAKGYDPTHNIDVGDIFMLQRDSWLDVYEKYRLGESEHRRRDVLSGWSSRAFIGNAGRVLEAFTAYLSGRSAQDKPGPDWSRRGESRCGYCEGRGIVSNIPVASADGRFDGIRLYSFACVCDRGRMFGGMKTAEEWMLLVAVKRAGMEAERLRQWRRDNDCDADTLGDFLKRFRVWLAKQGGMGSMFRSANEPKVRTARTAEIVEVDMLPARKPAAQIEAKEAQECSEDEESVLSSW